MAGAGDDNQIQIPSDFNFVVDSIKIDEPRYNSLVRIVEWGIAICIGTILAIISNSDKFKIDDPRINAIALIAILIFMGIATGLLLYYKILLYLYDRKAVHRVAVATMFNQLSPFVAKNPEYKDGVFSAKLFSAKRKFLGEMKSDDISSILSIKKEPKIMIAAIISYLIGLVLYIAYFGYALLTDP